MTIILTVLLLFIMTRSINLGEEGKFHQYLWLGFCTRIFLLICTVTDILPIPDAHVDADSFHETAVLNQGSDMSNWEHLTNYTFFLSVTYYVTDSSRWFAQFVNVILGMYFLIYLRKILCILDIDLKYARTILLVAALMPFYNIYSVVLMREAWVTFFVAFSLFYFICWFRNIGNSNKNIVFSIGGVFIAMWMHAGVVGVLSGYVMAFLTYYRKGNKIKISPSTYAALFLISLFVLVLILNINVIAEKLIVSDIGEYAEKKSAGEGGGSDYLTWLDLSSPMNLLLFSPLKMLYFLYSPIILDWRGLNDVAAFIMDSLFYILVTWFALTRKESNKQLTLLKRFLVISLIATVFVFSIGTSNTGTAIRHRAKLGSLMLTLWALSPPRNDKKQTLQI